MKKNVFLLLLACSVSVLAFADLRKGVLPGEFYVSPTKKVHFSSGNFQSGSYANRLAEHQYDYIAGSNSKISSSWNYSGYFDLFGWGKGYSKYSTDSTAYENYVEWGEYRLSNADNVADWRTLTIDEWRYLLFNSPAQVGFGTVADKKGLILLPPPVVSYLDAAGTPFVTIKKEDNWQITSEKGIYGIKSKNTYFTDNKYDATKWEELEKLGAVFLPAAYYRTTSSSSSTTVDAVLYTGVGCGYYWSSSPVEGTIQTAGYISFGVAQYPAGESHVYAYEAKDATMKRYNGMSVRLVTENGEYNPVKELDTIQAEPNKETAITFTYSGPSSSAVLLTLQADDYFNELSQCVVLRTTLEDAFVANLMDNILQDIGEFSSVYSGVSFFLPAGKGEIKLDICTYGLELSVHIGNSGVARLTKDERGEAVVQYEILEPTLVCLHASEPKASGMAGRRVKQQMNDALKQVELYGIKILPSKVDGAGFEGIFKSSNSQIFKFFRNGQLYILRDGKVYTPAGQEVK